MPFTFDITMSFNAYFPDALKEPSMVGHWNKTGRVSDDDGMAHDDGMTMSILQNG
jgi:hypothetical protein